MNDFAPSSDLLAFLRGWEGVAGAPALRAYLDNRGTPTIGYGHTAGVRMGDTCSPDQAEQWLMDEATHFMGCVCKCVGMQMSQNEADACASFAYNEGSAAFAGSSICRYMNTGRFDLAANVFPLWNKEHVPGGPLEPDVGLTKRRAAEQAIFLSGDYSGRP